jgi:hypothetical protein
MDASYYVQVRPDVFEYFKKEGYKPLRDQDACLELVKHTYKLGDNLRLFIDRNKVLKPVTGVLIGIDADQRQLMTYTVDKTMFGPVGIVDGSWCSVFKSIADPAAEDDDFKMNLTMWTKGPKWYNSRAYAVLVYHCPKMRSVSGGVGGAGQPASSAASAQAATTPAQTPATAKTKDDKSLSKTVIGTSALVLSVLGLGLALYWKKRQNERRLEAALAKMN